MFCKNTKPLPGPITYDYRTTYRIYRKRIGRKEKGIGLKQPQNVDGGWKLICSIFYHANQFVLHATLQAFNYMIVLLEFVYYNLINNNL